MNSLAFLEIIKEVALDSEAQAYLKEITQNLPQDLSPDRTGYYTDETINQLFAEAARRLHEDLATKSQPVDFHTLRSSWASVLTDYHRNNNWNYPLVDRKPPRPLTEDQKNTREVAIYIWIAIQTVLVLKTAVFYFGMHSASQPSDTNSVMLVVTIVSLLATLVYFIWSRSKKEPKE